MARIWYAHFDSTADDIRELLAEDWAKYIRGFVTDGVRNGGTCLEATAGEGLSVNIDLGTANVQGYFFMNEEDEEGRYYNVKLPPANPQYPRVDRVVLRLDRRIQSRTILPLIKLGTAANDPVPPELQRDQHIYELSLARINVSAGAVSLVNQNVIDERYNTELCGLMNSVLGLDPSSWQRQVDEVIEILKALWQEKFEEQLALWQEWSDTYNAWFAAVKHEIAKLQTFYFDNLAALAESRKDTVFGANSVTETIVNRFNSVKIADRKTTFNADNSITEVTTVFAKDGKSIFKRATITTTFNTDGTVTEICSGFDDYSLDAAYGEGNIVSGTYVSAEPVD